MSKGGHLSQPFQGRGREAFRKSLKRQSYSRISLRHGKVSANTVLEERPSQQQPALLTPGTSPASVIQQVRLLAGLQQGPREST